MTAQRKRQIVKAAGMYFSESRRWVSVTPRGAEYFPTLDEAYQAAQRVREEHAADAEFERALSAAPKWRFPNESSSH